MAGLTRSQAFDALGLPYDATEEQIKHRFKKLALRWHPDKNLYNQKEAHEKFQSISAAYSRLAASEGEEAIEDISPATLSKLITEIWDDYKGKPSGFWNYEDSDSDPDEPGYRQRVFSDRALADHFLREILFKNFEAPPVSRTSKVPRRQPRKSTWNKNNNTTTVPSIKISPEEASRNADELLQAEEVSKQQEEKRKLKNKKKKDSKKKRKAKQLCEDCGPSASEGGEGGEGGAGDADKSDGEDSDEQVDVTSAFVVRAKSKQKEQPSLSSSKKNTVLAASNTDPSEDKENSDSVKVVEKANATSVKAPSAKMPSRVTAKTHPTSSVKEPAVSEADIARSRQLAAQGNRAAKDGHFSEAVRRYSEAIDLYSKDHRYFGNRSFCYEYLKEYESALTDAETALQLDAHWPKGHYRRGKALAGLKKSVDAERSYRRALDLDPAYRDAEDELLKICLNRLVGMGFQSTLAETALREYKTVEASIAAIVSGKVQTEPVVLGGPTVEATSKQQQQQSKQTDKNGGSSQQFYNHNGFSLPPRLRQPPSQQQQQQQQQQQPQQQQPPAPVQKPAPSKRPPVESPPTPAQWQRRALWVGNITANVTEPMLRVLFEEFGDIMYIRRLPDRHCAFVNYNQDNSASQALLALQGHHIGGCYLLIRFPENPAKEIGSARSKKQAGPVAGAKSRASAEVSSSSSSSSGGKGSGGGGGVKGSAGKLPNSSAGRKAAESGSKGRKSGVKASAREGSEGKSTGGGSSNNGGSAGQGNSASDVSVSSGEPAKSTNAVSYDKDISGISGGTGNGRSSVEDQTNTGNKSSFTAGNSDQGTTLGGGSSFTAGNSDQGTTLGGGSSFTAGNSDQGTTLGGGSSFTAGSSDLGTSGGVFAVGSSDLGTSGGVFTAGSSDLGTSGGVFAAGTSDLGTSGGVFAVGTSDLGTSGGAFAVGTSDLGTSGGAFAAVSSDLGTSGGVFASGTSDLGTSGRGSISIGGMADECYFWRNTGCSYGEKCCYLHLPENRGVDLKDKEP